MIMSRALDIDVAKRPLRRSTSAVAPVDHRGGEVFAHPLVPVLTGVVVAALVALAIGHARSAGLIAGLWAAGGVSVAVWLRASRGLRQDVAFFVLLTTSVLIGQLIAGNKPVLSIMFTFANMVEIGGAVILARRFLPSLDVSSLSGAGRFLVAVSLVPPIPAAFLISFALAQLGPHDFWEGFQTWWFGHALGLAIIGVFGVSLTGTTLNRLKRPAALGEAALLIGAILAVQGLGLVSGLEVDVATIPLLLVVAVRLGVAGAAFSLIIVAALSVGGAMADLGPLAYGTKTVNVMMAQVQVLVAYMPILLVAALLEERDRLADQARLGQARAERASESKSRLLANVAHEIKSPVAGVIGIGNLWSSGQLGPITPQQAEMADMLVKTARQVEALAHDLLDLARAESGAIKIDLRPTNVSGLLEDVRRAARLRPDASAVELQIASEGDDVIALADSQRLVQIIDNLLSNALKYGASGGRVLLRAVGVEDGVRIEVTDFGPGLSSEKQAQLFEPFNRLGLERSSIEGHGVGLAIAKRLVELQGGAIGVVSAPGQGATFWLTLPKA
ncbi:histidine kinase [Pseudomonas sp. ODNR1LW]|nr:histidine kinase [Pseudomonas sp. ODNR1LW]